MSSKTHLILCKEVANAKRPLFEHSIASMSNQTEKAPIPISFDPKSQKPKVKTLVRYNSKWKHGYFPCYPLPAFEASSIFHSASSTIFFSSSCLEVMVVLLLPARLDEQSATSSPVEQHPRRHLGWAHQLFCYACPWSTVLRVLKWLSIVVHSRCAIYIFSSQGKGGEK